MSNYLFIRDRADPPTLNEYKWSFNAKQMDITHTYPMEDQ